jgi:hypothetical protein
MLTGDLGLTRALDSFIAAFVKADGLRAEVDVLLQVVGRLEVLALSVLAPPVRGGLG